LFCQNIETFFVAAHQPFSAEHVNGKENSDDNEDHGIGDKVRALKS